MIPLTILDVLNDVNNKINKLLMVIYLFKWIPGRQLLNERKINKLYHLIKY